MKAISGKRLCQILEKKGWAFERAKGSHHIYTHPDGRKLPVPVHVNRDLPIGTQKGIMRQAGLTEADL
jgi:predicted RNA binding protein YcfA (HicA-like mRNA interferase family)